MQPCFLLLYSIVASESWSRLSGTQDFYLELTSLKLVQLPSWNSFYLLEAEVLFLKNWAKTAETGLDSFLDCSKTTAELIKQL